MKGRINVNKLLDDFVFQDDGTSVNLLFETYVDTKNRKKSQIEFFLDVSLNNELNSVII